MKKFLLVCVLLMAMSFSYASQNVEIVDARIKRSEIFEVVKKWTITTLDAYDATILYEDKNSGNIIIKGKYQHKGNYLSARILKHVIPYVTFQIEVQCDDGKVVGTLREIEYSYVTLDEDLHGLPSKALDRLICEFETIRNIMIEKGENWIVDDSFVNEYKEQKALMDEAARKKEDVSLPKSERRKWKKYYENETKKVTLEVYEYAVDAKYDAEEKILKKSKGCLYDVVCNYLKKQ